MYIIDIMTSRTNRLMLEVKDYETAYVAFQSACKMIDLAANSDKKVELWDDETSEVLNSYGEIED